MILTNNSINDLFNRYKNPRAKRQAREKCCTISAVVS